MPQPAGFAAGPVGVFGYRVLARLPLAAGAAAFAGVARDARLRAGYPCESSRWPHVPGVAGDVQRSLLSAPPQRSKEAWKAARPVAVDRAYLGVPSLGGRVFASRARRRGFFASSLALGGGAAVVSSLSSVFVLGFCWRRGLGLPRALLKAVSGLPYARLRAWRDASSRSRPSLACASPLPSSTGVLRALGVRRWALPIFGVVGLLSACFWDR